MASAKDKDGVKKAPGVKYLGLDAGRKKWRVRLVKRDPKTGKKLVDTWRTVHAATLGAALTEQGRLLTAEVEAKLGRQRVGERLRFTSAVDEWLATLDVEGTRQSWGSHAKALKAHFGEWWLDQITASDLQRYLASRRKLRTGEPLAPGTVNSMRDVLVRVFRRAHEQGLVSVNVAEQTMRIRVRQSRRERAREQRVRKRRSLLAHEVPTFFALLRQHEPEAYPVVRTQFALGCRFSEVTALRLTDVDWRTGLVHIRQAQVRGHVDLPKGSYERIAALGPEALEVLKRHRARMEALKWPGWEEYVFPRPLSTRRKHSTLWSISSAHHAVKRTLKRMGIAAEVAGSTHLSRHTSVNMGRRIDPVTTRLVAGHQSEDETMTYSMATAPEALEHAAAVERAMLGPGGNLAAKSVSRRDK